MPMYNSIEYSDNYSKTSGSLWQYYKYELHVNARVSSESSEFKRRITGKISATGNTKDIERIVPLKHLINIWRTLEMLLTNFEINLILA